MITIDSLQELNALFDGTCNDFKNLRGSSLTEISYGNLVVNSGNMWDTIGSHSIQQISSRPTSPMGNHGNPVPAPYGRVTLLVK